MRGVDRRLAALEARVSHRSPAAVATWLMTEVEAGRIYDVLKTLGDGVIEDVLRFQLASGGYTGPLDDELLAVIAAGTVDPMGSDITGLE